MRVRPGMARPVQHHRGGVRYNDGGGNHDDAGGRRIFTSDTLISDLSPAMYLDDRVLMVMVEDSHGRFTCDVGVAPVHHSCELSNACVVFCDVRE